jgi:hypothetical protein
MPSDQKENKSKVLPHFLFYRKICLSLIRTDICVYRCPRVAKKLHNLFVIEDINYSFFLDDSYASTTYSEDIAVYIQGVPIL